MPGLGLDLDQRTARDGKLFINCDLAQLCGNGIGIYLNGGKLLPVSGWEKGLRPAED